MTKSSGGQTIAQHSRLQVLPMHEIVYVANAWCVFCFWPLSIHHCASNIPFLKGGFSRPSLIFSFFFVSISLDRCMQLSSYDDTKLPIIKLFYRRCSVNRSCLNLDPTYVRMSCIPVSCTIKHVPRRDFGNLAKELVKNLSISGSPEVQTVYVLFFSSNTDICRFSLDIQKF